MEQKLVALSGNEAVAYAFKQAKPHVASAFPITPQTEMMHKFAEFVANGESTTEMILVESEHSAMSAAVGSAAAGARTFTATSSAGFALMWEIVYVAASLRLPICMALVNRALSGNINIHCDHSDSMGGRDAGWIHLFSENAQEAYDNGIMAWRIAEHMDVRLPVMVNYDGFIISHTADALHMLDDETAYKFIGKYPAGLYAAGHRQSDYRRPAGSDGLLLRAQDQPAGRLRPCARDRAPDQPGIRRPHRPLLRLRPRSTCWTTPSWSCSCWAAAPARPRTSSTSTGTRVSRRAC